jgi:SAM-dependent methyltransferase
LKQFLETLKASGYRQFYLAFGDANFRKHDWPAGAKNLTGALLDLVKLFLLQEPVPSKRATALLGKDFARELIQCEVLREQGKDFRSNDFYLIFCRSYALLCQMNANPCAYFGDDSLALATLQTPAPGGTVLDLCCGPGIQGFVAASSAARVTGVEIRKETWRVAELNRRLNNLGERVTFVCKSAEEFARSDKQKFDRILFNPPLVPMVPGYKFAFAGNGGGDGLEVTRRILELYHRKISATGSVEFIGMGLGRNGQPLVAEQIKKMAKRLGLGGRIHLLSQHPIRPGAPLFEVCVSSLARENGLTAVEARKILGGHFAGLKMDAYWLFFASLNRGAGSASTIDLSKSFWGHWFV